MSQIKLAPKNYSFKGIREHHGKTQLDIAILWGCSVRQIRRIEKSDKMIHRLWLRYLLGYNVFNYDKHL